jgi:hypothetical protein
MNLDDLERFAALDPQGMLQHIDGLGNGTGPFSFGG